jgi:hypothetical protein
MVRMIRKGWETKDFLELFGGEPAFCKWLPMHHRIGMRPAKSAVHREREGGFAEAAFGD